MSAQLRRPEAATLARHFMITSAQSGGVLALVFAGSAPGQPYGCLNMARKPSPSAGPAGEERRREFERLVRPEWPYAVRYAQKYLFCAEDAQDTVTDAAIKAFKAFGRFRAGADFGNWFRAILHNTILDRLRVQRRAVSKLKRVHLPDELIEKAVTTDLEPWGGMSESMYFAIRQLEPRYQEVLKLRFEYDQSLKEIGVEMGVSVAAARELVRSAIAALKSALETES